MVQLLFSRNYLYIKKIRIATDEIYCVICDIFVPFADYETRLLYPLPLLIYFHPSPSVTCVSITIALQYIFYLTCCLLLIDFLSKC